MTVNNSNLDFKIKDFAKKFDRSRKRKIPYISQRNPRLSSGVFCFPSLCKKVGMG